MYVCMYVILLLLLLHFSISTFLYKSFRASGRRARVSLIFVRRTLVRRTQIRRSLLRRSAAGRRIEPCGGVPEGVEPPRSSGLGKPPLLLFMLNLLCSAKDYKHPLNSAGKRLGFGLDWAGKSFEFPFLS